MDERAQRSVGNRSTGTSSRACTSKHLAKSFGNICSPRLSPSAMLSEAIHSTVEPLRERFPKITRIYIEGTSPGSGDGKAHHEST